VSVDAEVPLTPRPNPHNLRYLRTKRDRMGHQIPGLPPDGATTVASSVERSRDHEVMP